MIDSTTLFNGFNIAGVIIGILLLVLMLESNSPFKGGWIIYWILAIMLHQIYFFLNINEVINKYSWINLFGFPWAMVHLPLFYLNIRDITGLKIQPADAFYHFVPYFAYVLILFGFYSSGSDIRVVNGFLYFPENTHHILRTYNGIPMALSGVVYVLLSFRILINHKSRITNYYSYLEDINLAWIKNLVWFIGILFLVIYALVELSIRMGSLTADGFKYVSIILTIFTAYYGFRYYRQIEIFYLSSNYGNPKKEKYAKSVLSRDEMENIQHRILTALVEKRVYLDEDLNLAKLSKLLGIPAARLSETLNKHMKTTFYDLINKHRIIEAIAMLKDPASNKLSIEGIGFECGFKSKSTFFKLFKRETGLTPRMYKETM